MFIIKEIINLAEITIIANKFLKEGKLVTEILHDFNRYNYTFSFLDTNETSVENWVRKLKEKEVEELYIGFSVPMNIYDVAIQNCTPAGLMCKYANGQITCWTKRWKGNNNGNDDVLYKEKLVNPEMYSVEFSKRFESNFKYFKYSIKKVIELAKKVECDEWIKYFEQVFELEDINNAKEFPATKNMYNILPDRNLCVYAMAVQAYPFGGMNSWCDIPALKAEKLGIKDSFIKDSRELFLEIMGMISYATYNL